MIDWKSALRKLASELGLTGSRDQNKATRTQSSASAHPAAATKPGNADATPSRPGLGLATPARYVSTVDSHENRTKESGQSSLPKDESSVVDTKPKPAQLNSASSGPFAQPDMRDYPVGYEDCEGISNQQWQTLGTSATIGRIQAGRRSLCTVGLDFGTAFTKACIEVRNSTYVVHWDKCVKSSPPFLLPSLFSELQDETCILGSHERARQHSDIKMALLGNPTEFNQAAAVVFIALVTRYIRAWLFSEHRSVIEGYKLDWAMNVGLPASSWDRSETATLYKRLALAGWRLGAMATPIGFATARSELSSLVTGAESPFEHIHEDMIETFPEFGAQVHSYRSSAQRQRDLHLLVDIGAGTVDVVTFHIGEEDESEINCILEPLVKKLGTHILLGYRAEAGRLDGRVWTDSTARMSRSAFESSFGLRPGSLNPVQEHFTDLLHLSIRRVLHTTKAVRYETSPKWSEGVPYFLSGGGRNVDAFREAIRKTTSERKMVELSLPVPENVVLGSVSNIDFHRMSVAHGLSSPAENLAKTLRKSEVPDLRRARSNRTDYSERYIDK
jgi:hypothetical protein